MFCCQGVKFMYDCVTGKQIEGSTGCIMADEMVVLVVNRIFTIDNFSEVVAIDLQCMLFLSFVLPGHFDL